MIISIVIISLITLAFCYNLLLNYLDKKSINRPIPENVKGIYNDNEYKKWLSYKHDQSKLKTIAMIINFVILMTLLVSKVFLYFVNLTDDVLLNSALVILVYQAAFMIPNIIFRYIDIMKIEAKYGFNKTTKKTFVIDTIKSIIFELVITLGLIELFGVLHQSIGTWAIVIFTVVVFIFLIFIFMFNSKLAKLDNKFVKLEEGSLRTKLEKLLSDNGYKVKDILVMDGSKRSTKANAYFTGLGKFKTIVLFDTLINLMTENEIVAVFAHELGHGKHKDVQKNLFVSLFNVLLIAVLFEISLYIQLPFSESTVINYGASYIILGELIMNFIMPFFSICTNYFSRKHEYEADGFAVEQGYGRNLITGLKKLSKNNFSDLNPHPLIVKLSYSHPPMSERIQAIENKLPQDKMCFTINQLRKKEEILSYHELFDKKLFSGVEIFYPINTGEGQYEQYTSSIKELLNKYSYLERVLHLPHGKKYSLCDLDIYKENLQIMKDASDYANEFNVKKLTLHLGWYNPELNRDDIVNHIIAVLKELCEYVKKYNMNIMIENMPASNEMGYSPEEILHIIKSVEADNLKFIFDTGHAHVSEYEDDSYLYLLKDYLMHIHYSDNDTTADKHQRIGSGTIDFTKHFDALDDIKYNELHCLEIIYNTKEDLEQYLLDYKNKKYN